MNLMRPDNEQDQYAGNIAVRVAANHASVTTERLRLAVVVAMVIGAHFICLLTAVEAVAQTPVSKGKPTELVVVRYEKLIADGALLTPEGWKRTTRIFDQSYAYPQNGEIFLTSAGGSVGENWSKGDRAEVETKWTDYYGSIDSALRFKRPENPNLTMTIYTFSLVFTNRHQEIANGKTINDVTGAWEWKLKGPQRDRWATIKRAIAYVMMIRDQSTDAAIVKNANKTIAILKRLHSACTC